jgi:hypothetical protein
MFIFALGINQTSLILHSSTHSLSAIHNVDTLLGLLYTAARQVIEVFRFHIAAFRFKYACGIIIE